MSPCRKRGTRLGRGYRNGLVLGAVVPPLPTIMYWTSNKCLSLLRSSSAVREAKFVESGATIVQTLLFTVTLDFHRSGSLVDALALDT